jgi:hypothetical protein
MTRPYHFLHRFAPTLAHHSARPLAAVAAMAGAGALVLWLGWIAMTAANATLARHEYPSWPPYDVADRLD